MERKGNLGLGATIVKGCAIKLLGIIEEATGQQVTGAPLRRARDGVRDAADGDEQFHRQPDGSVGRPF